MNWFKSSTSFAFAIACLIVCAPTALGKTFAGYECTDDCSGHIAGYRWAQQHDIVDPGDCDGNSESFIEGYMAYAEGDSPDIEDDDNDEDPPAR